MSGTFSFTPTPAQNNQDFILNFTAQDGKGGSDLRSYTVRVRGAVTPNVPPTVTITRPADGATYLPGQNVTASYACADSDGTVASCVGPVANGQPINTATSGNKTFSVTATDNEGATKTKTVSYRVGVVTGLCRGTAVSVLAFDPATANPAEAPCVTRSKTVAGVNTKLASGGLLSLLGNTLSASLLEASTTAAATSARAEAHVADVTVRLGLTTVRIQGVHSKASSTLTSCGSATVAGTSSVASLNVGGVAIAVPGPLSVPLLAGAIHLNQTTRSGNTTTQRAVFIDLPGTSLDIVIGESKAGVACS